MRNNLEVLAETMGIDFIEECETPNESPDEVIHYGNESEIK